MDPLEVLEVEVEDLRTGEVTRFSAFQAFTQRPRTMW